MTKTLVLKRLRATIGMLKSLKPTEFKFNNWVTRFNNKTKCGTVCCIAGWYPAYFPEAGLEWSNGKLTTTPSRSDNKSVVLSNYHGLKENIIDVIFTGFAYDCEIESFEEEGFITIRKSITLDYAKEKSDVSIKDAINMIERVIYLVKNYPEAVLL